MTDRHVHIQKISGDLNFFMEAHKEIWVNNHNYLLSKKDMDKLRIFSGSCRLINVFSILTKNETGTIEITIRPRKNAFRNREFLRFLNYCKKIKSIFICGLFFNLEKSGFPVNYGEIKNQTRKKIWEVEMLDFLENLTQNHNLIEQEAGEVLKEYTPKIYQPRFSSVIKKLIELKDLLELYINFEGSDQHAFCGHFWYYLDDFSGIITKNAKEARKFFSSYYFEVPKILFGSGRTL